MKTSSAKAKGRKLQYWVADKVAILFNENFVYSDDQCPIKSRGMGQSGTDVMITDRIMHEQFPYGIECKNTEKVSLYNYIEQAKANCKKDEPWLVFHKKNRSKPIAILDAEEFFRIIQENKELKEKING